MGVQISFVRSIDLDNWNMKYLRNMRVGGNKAAKEFFSKNGGARYLSSAVNSKEKYTSTVAAKYLKELERLSKIDARKFPGEEALSTNGVPSLGGKSDDLDEVQEKNGSTDDFFANWDRPLVKKPTPPVSRSETPVSRTSSPLAKATPATTTSRIVPASKSKANILGSRKAGTSSILSTKKPSKFTAKKITSEEIDFDAAEKEAQKEADAVSSLGYNPSEEIESPVFDKSASKPSSTATVSSNQPAEDVRKKFVKLGFGQTSAPAAAASNGSSGSSTPRRAVAAPVSDGSVVAKFGNQKAISSDQMFGRNAYDPSAQAEARTRLQSFGNAKSISSSSYFGTNEEEERSISSNGGPDFERIADRVRNIANEDLGALKDALDQGASKLSGFMRDYLR